VVLRPAATSDQAGFSRTLLRTGIESLRPATRPAAGLPQRCNAAFLVLDRTSHQQLGFSMLHALDPAGHIKCGIYLDAGRARLGVGAEALHLLINYAFASFDVDRVIAETTEASFSSLGMTAEPDGGERQTILAGYTYFRGQLWDLHRGEITRRDWERFVDLATDRILPPPLTWRTPPTRSPAGA
jgi:hypothetical protein